MTIDVPTPSQIRARSPQTDCDPASISPADAVAIVTSANGLLGAIDALAAMPGGFGETVQRQLAFTAARLRRDLGNAGVLSAEAGQ